VIGQEQDSVGGGFNSAETFVGQLTQLNVWSRELSLKDIENLRTSCEKRMGDVIAWTDVHGSVAGAVVEEPIDFCKGNQRHAEGTGSLSRYRNRTREKHACLPMPCMKFV